MPNNVFLLLGSNLGDSVRNLALAKENILHSLGPILKKSSIYKTAPWGVTNQPEFLNQVILIETTFNPVTVLSSIMSIEEEMGRFRKEKWGARLIDIDILFYNKEVIHQHNLSIPHPAIAFRKFTLEPLAEIAADFIHPELHKTIAVLLHECEDNSRVEKTDL